MKKSKLINYTTQDFVSEKELELKLFRWNNVKDKYLPKLKANEFKNGYYKGLE